MKWPPPCLFYLIFDIHKNLSSFSVVSIFVVVTAVAVAVFHLLFS